MNLIKRILGNKQTGDNARNDGYSAYNARVICSFQADIEKSANCDYAALRDTLGYARTINDYKVTPVGLRARYTNLAENILADRK